MNVRVYVEGGGNGKELRTMCRRGFSSFFRKVNLVGRMPKVIACGSRQSAYDKFRTALLSNNDQDFIVLLVDSEGPVAEDSRPWLHLRNRDNWVTPDGVTDDNAHLMVQCMEAWFLADKGALARYFGDGFNENPLPRQADVEEASKHDIEQGLKMATRQCKQKGVYDKGRHSFAILAELDSERVITGSLHARRLIDTLLARAL